ncbi:hypothetical protein CLF_110566 [Clonorchis sinensis]|uniref:Uncharacterized protein n=1 Tax=Clonorchis sinensis TaxID=79923 RepID=G7YTN8_CLOSI|nr:hypothetical protein CLF_110566 [Clonorchis sinensis]
MVQESVFLRTLRYFVGYFTSHSNRIMGTCAAYGHSGWQFGPEHTARFPATMNNAVYKKPHCGINNSRILSSNLCPLKMNNPSRNTSSGSNFLKCLCCFLQCIDISKTCVFSTGRILTALLLKHCCMRLPSARNNRLTLSLDAAAGVPLGSSVISLNYG